MSNFKIKIMQKNTLKILTLSILTTLTINTMAQTKEHIDTKTYIKKNNLSTAVSAEVIINKSPEEVWKVISNWGDAYLYTSGLDKSYCTSEAKKGIESKRHCDIGKGSVEEEILIYEENVRMILQVSEFNMPMMKKIIVEFELFNQGGKTRLRQTMAYKMPLGKLMKGKMKSNLKINVHGIKHYIETGDSKIAKDPKQLKKLYY